MEWNRVHYIDCMDPEKGLPSLPDKSIDLGFTDPKFNVKYKSKSSMKRLNTIPYEDYMIPEKYKEWSSLWFKEMKRICNTLIIHCGKVNLKMWYEIEAPYDIIIWYPFSMSPSPGKASWSCRMHPFICYGKFGKKRLNKDVYPLPLKLAHKGKLVHTCPLNLTIVEQMIEQLKPTSVLDPFIGSGTTAEVCTKLGIPWIGYEINEVYSQDINKRLKGCKREPKQTTLEAEIFQ